MSLADTDDVITYLTTAAHTYDFIPRFANAQRERGHDSSRRTSNSEIQPLCVCVGAGPLPRGSSSVHLFGRSRYALLAQRLLFLQSSTWMAWMVPVWLCSLLTDTSESLSTEKLLNARRHRDAAAHEAVTPWRSPSFPPLASAHATIDADGGGALRQLSGNREAATTLAADVVGVDERHSRLTDGVRRGRRRPRYVQRKKLHLRAPATRNSPQRRLRICVRVRAVTRPANPLTRTSRMTDPVQPTP